MAVINHLLGNIPANRAVSTLTTGFASTCGIILLVWHYEHKSIHLPIYMIVIFFIFAIFGGISFLILAFYLLKEWKKAALPEQEVAPPEQELPQLPVAPEP